MKKYKKQAKPVYTQNRRALIIIHFSLFYTFSLFILFSHLFILCFIYKKGQKSIQKDIKKRKIQHKKQHLL
jgi:hypothetical protein